MKKKKGFIGIGILFVMFIFIQIIIFAFAIEIYFTNAKGQIAQNDITISNLAVYKDLDMDALGNNPPAFRISDPNKALQDFEYYLGKNMDLDAELNASDHSIAVNKVNITSYIIYDISGVSADIFTYNPSTQQFTETTVSDIIKAPVYTPDGVKVTKTAIHTEIEFDIIPLMQGIEGKTRAVKTQANTYITR